MTRTRCNQWLAVLGCAAALAVVPACATVKVRTDTDPQVDFSRYHTFKVEPGKIVWSGIGDTGNTLAAERIGRAIVENLAAHGLTPAATPGDADLTVRFKAGTELMQEIQRVPSPGYGVNYSWPAYPAYGDVWVTDYTRETLVIDLVDRASDRVVWHVVAVADHQDFSSPDRVVKAVAKALEKFPRAS